MNNMLNDKVKTDKTFVVMPITSATFEVIGAGCNHGFGSGEGGGECCICFIPCIGTFDCILLPFRLLFRLFKKKKVDPTRLNEQTRNGVFESKRWVMV